MTHSRETVLPVGRMCARQLPISLSTALRTLISEESVWFTHLGRALHCDIEQVVAGAANLDDCQILLAGQAAVGSREDSMQAHDLLSIRADILGKMWERRRSLQHRALARHHRQTPNPQHDQHTPDGAEPDIGLVISNVG